MNTVEDLIETLISLSDELKEPLNTSLGSTEFTNGINVANYATAKRLDEIIVDYAQTQEEKRNLGND